jgi:hypothetical protein
LNPDERESKLTPRPQQEQAKIEQKALSQREEWFLVVFPSRAVRRLDHFAGGGGRNAV